MLLVRIISLHYFKTAIKSVLNVPTRGTHVCAIHCGVFCLQTEKFASILAKIIPKKIKKRTTRNSRKIMTSCKNTFPQCVAYFKSQFQSSTATSSLDLIMYGTLQWRYHDAAKHHVLDFWTFFREAKRSVFSGDSGFYLISAVENISKLVCDFF